MIKSHVDLSICNQVYKMRVMESLGDAQASSDLYAPAP